MPKGDICVWLQAKLVMSKNDADRPQDGLLNEAHSTKRNSTSVLSRVKNEPLLVIGDNPHWAPCFVLGPKKINQQNVWTVALVVEDGQGTEGLLSSCVVNRSGQRALLKLRWRRLIKRTGSLRFHAAADYGERHWRRNVHLSSSQWRPRLHCRKIMLSTWFVDLSRQNAKPGQDSVDCNCDSVDGRI